jgi:hypothetical protein
VREANRVADFRSHQFAIRLFRDACGHQAGRDRGTVPEGLTIRDLPQRLRCAACSRRECAMRIGYAAAGGVSRRT